MSELETSPRHPDWPHPTPPPSPIHALFSNSPPLPGPGRSEGSATPGERPSHAEEDRNKRRRESAHAQRTFQPGRAGLVLAVLPALLIATVFTAVGTGAVAISPREILAIFASHGGVSLPWTFAPHQDAVLWDIRLPRVVLGALVGATLAVAGATLQGLFRNPLADPALIGVSSGAALAAVAVIVLGATVLQGLNELLGVFTLPLAAFGGGLLTTLLVYRLANVGGRTSVATMLLAGIAINALVGACTGMLTYIADDQQLRSLTFWSMGSLGGANWSQVAAVAPIMILALVVLTLQARALDALLLGEAEAGHLGFDAERIKRQCVVWVALAVGMAVAMSGIIGFLGLVVPHLLRLALGPNHRYVLPGSLLLGATLLITADLAARVSVAPAELPIGMLTAVLGGPFFLWLLWRSRRKGEL